MLKEKGVDTLILGCTHYPLLTDVIKEIMGDGVSLISPGVETAVYTKDLLEREGIINLESKQGETKYYVSDDTKKFSYLASMFLNEKITGTVEKINIEEW